MEKTTLHSESMDRLISIDLDRAIEILSQSIEMKGGQKNQMAEPELKFKLGPFSAAIFLNEVDGRQKPSVSLEKAFTRDGENWEYQKIRLLDSREIDRLICLLQDVKTTIYKEFE